MIDANLIMFPVIIELRANKWRPASMIDNIPFFRNYSAVELADLGHHSHGPFVTLLIR